MTSISRRSGPMSRANAVGQRLVLLLEQTKKRTREESLRSLIDRLAAAPIETSARAGSTSSPAWVRPTDDSSVRSDLARER